MQGNNDTAISSSTQAYTPKGLYLIFAWMELLRTICLTSVFAYDMTEKLHVAVMTWPWMAL